MPKLFGSEKRPGTVYDPAVKRLVQEIRDIARGPKGHSFKRRKSDSFRKIWGMPPKGKAKRKKNE